jgi:uncharacterized membrane protein
MTDPSPRTASPRDLERAIARVLMTGTYLSVTLLAIGVVLMLLAGISPLDAGPSLDPAAILTDIATLQPAGFLWLGLIAVIATPTARVAASLLGYGLERDWTMVAISIGILGVIVISVILAVGLDG